MSIVNQVRQALADPATVAAADKALALVKEYLGGAPVRLPGMSTHSRLAVRIANGRTVEEAAAREYAYRWHLPLDQWVNHTEARSRSRPVTGAWPVPHAIGM